MEENYVDAHKWLNIVATRAPNPEDAINRRDEIAAKMTAEELAEAEQKASEWLKSHPLPAT
jgi:hypothetical protein